MRSDLASREDHAREVRVCLATLAELMIELVGKLSESEESTEFRSYLGSHYSLDRYLTEILDLESSLYSKPPDFVYGCISAQSDITSLVAAINQFRLKLRTLFSEMSNIRIWTPTENGRTAQSFAQYVMSHLGYDQVNPWSLYRKFVLLDEAPRRITFLQVRNISVARLTIKEVHDRLTKSTHRCAEEDLARLKRLGQDESMALVKRGQTDQIRALVKFTGMSKRRTLHVSNPILFLVKSAGHRPEVRWPRPKKPRHPRPDKRLEPQPYFRSQSIYRYLKE